MLLNINLYSRLHYSLKFHLAYVGSDVRLVLRYSFNRCRKLVQEVVFVELTLFKLELDLLLFVLKTSHVHNRTPPSFQIEIAGHFSHFLF